MSNEPAHSHEQPERIEKCHPEIQWNLILSFDLQIVMSQWEWEAKQGFVLETLWSQTIAIIFPVIILNTIAIAIFPHFLFYCIT